MSNNEMVSPLTFARIGACLRLPQQLSKFPHMRFREEKEVSVRPEVEEYFSSTRSAPLLVAERGLCPQDSKKEVVRIGVLFSGGPSPGGHNVVLGLSEAMTRLSTRNKLFGFQEGFWGLLHGDYVELSHEFLRNWTNSGGFHLLSTSRTKLVGQQAFEQAMEVCQSLDLNGLVVIGGDDSNTNAGLLAEFFQKQNFKTSVIGVPKTIDGDLKGHSIEISFGHDTASKVISELVGNVCMDALSCKKNYHFIRLMGRHASHLTLETALQVQPTYTLISEQIRRDGVSLDKLISSLAKLIKTRAQAGKNYGVILVPEGLIEQVPGIDSLMCVLNDLLARDPHHTLDTIHQSLDPASATILGSLPRTIQEQLLYDRDSHGNVAVSRIETERLLLSLVKQTLEKKASEVPFSALTHFFGYECRCAHPSHFDAHYCYALGMCAAALVLEERNGYMALITDLEKSVSSWQVKGVPLSSMFHKERRRGQWSPVIRKTLVNLGGPAFLRLKEMEERWAVKDCFLSPGPCQFNGNSLTDPHDIPKTLYLEKNACGS
ncbi:diphosphate--fructose-6-phosphate 1-phosphotransferase [Candidatus Similichlamydia laticola]|uniref:Pyrophosphate--fructose 6-phosphate 1-phosphotransferase n=1 Tax=Candidatus Similichlamydia laticola TaxID=2170265 RepID=A0A369KAF4_9BACT|nr:diphosphate--fructose-6-phosphate 1-phosphotransferase [Candidatus Similichlamydia laticola]RDB31581.1 Pyrophosphate-dependent fructose 6-phosphate-1-kinase [Candidatus Similichlamydia laticola]